MPRPPAPPSQPVGPKEVILVVGDADNFDGTGDDVLEAFLFDELNFFVTIADDADDSGQFGRNQGLAVISSSVNGNELDDEYFNARYPVLVMDDQAFEGMQMTDENDNGTENDEEIEIQDLNHPMIKSLGLTEEELVVYDNNNDIVFGEPADDAEIVASNSNDNDEGVIFIYEPGDELAEVDNEDPRIATSRRVGGFVSEESLDEDDLNATGEQLLENMILFTYAGNVEAGR
jgi:hypothetical protein